MAPKRKAPKMKVNLDIKYTSQGTTCESVLKKEREDGEFTAKMYSEIAETVHKISSDRKALLNHKFYFIHANYYVEYTAEKRNIPCEVAIGEYSIAEGVHRVLHFFPPVDTPNGLLPAGYKANFVEHSEATHEIPEPPFAAANMDFPDLTEQVIKFLTQNGSTEVPPVYTMLDNEAVNHSMTTVQDFFDIIEDFSRDGVKFKIYELPILASDLYNACLNFGQGFGSQTEKSMRSELVKDEFLYTQGIGCIFHETLGKNEFCSQATVCRWAFILSKFCARTVGVDLIPGQHFPDKAFVGQKSRQEEEEKKRDSASSTSGAPPRTGRKLGTNDSTSRFRKPEPEVDTRIYKVGNEPGIVSEIRVDKPNPLTEGTGVRLPTTRGRGFTLVSGYMNRDPGGFTKDDFPALGGRVGKGRGLKK